MARFEIVHSDDAEQPFHVRLIADNGEPLSVSENLTSMEAARTNVAAQAKALKWHEPRVVEGAAEPGLWIVYDGDSRHGRSVDVVMVDARAGSEPPC